MHEQSQEFDPIMAACHVRNYWRSCVVNEARIACGLTHDAMSQSIVENARTIGAALRNLLDELCEQDMRDGRTVGQHRYCQRRAGEIVRTYGEEM